MSDLIRQLTELLSRLPGVGKRTAQRLTFHLLGSPAEYVHKLGEMITSLPEKIDLCSECRNLADIDPCPICTDPRRDRSTVCVVASVPDLWAIEDTGGYRGLYQVLHGLLAPLDGIGPDDLHVDQLRTRIEKENIKEVILATRPSVEGEATALLVRQTLEGLSLKITRIASGVPHGGELEYVDRVTLGRSLDDRREIS